MKKILLLILLISVLSINAQTKGKVTYILVTKKDSVEKANTNPDKTPIENDVLKMIHNSLPVQGFLVFNDSVASYKAEEKVDIPGYMNINWIMAGGSSITYTDWSRDHHIRQSDFMGRTVRLKANPIDWTLTKQTKTINGYTCYLATLDKSIGDKKLKVWYTLEIPVKYGPAGFNGLPGLVIEIDDVLNRWAVEKIELNHKEADSIIEPTEGELMTEDEYRALVGNPFGKG